MAESKYARDTQRFECLGIDLNRPVDSVKPERFPLLKNMRSYQAGRLEPRFGITSLGVPVAGQSPLHSARRLNDPQHTPIHPIFTRVIGTGTHLAVGQSFPYTDIDSGYSGDPLAMVPYRPDQAADSWMYVADSIRMRKTNVNGALHTVGLPPPAAPPAAALTAPQYKVVDDFDSVVGPPAWVSAGPLTAPTLLSAGPGFRTNTTIAQINYDTAPVTSGWACISPVSMGGIGPGERVTFNTGGGTVETVNVQAVYPGSLATAIASILYDTAVPGLCSIVLATPIAQVARDALIHNTTTNENARILSISRGPDGLYSFKCATLGPWAVGNAVQVLPSFRAYLVNNHGAGETIRNDGMRVSSIAGTGTVTKIIALDLSLIAPGIPAYPDDYMHIGLRVDRPDLLTEGKVELDVDASINDFTRNFYSKAFRASDLTPSARNLQPLTSTRQQVVQRNIIDQPITIAQVSSYFPDSASKISQLPADFESRSRNAQLNALAVAGFDLTGYYYGNTISEITANAPQDDIAVSNQMGIGDSQWTELKFPLSDLLRAGTDLSRTLQNVASIRITLIVTGTLNFDMDSWWIGGGYGPDVQEGTGIPYIYRYRARVPTTGVKGNWSPATRSGVIPFRQQVAITPTQYPVPVGTSLTASDIVLDVQRFGGEIASWHYVGFMQNTATPQFLDKYPDDTVVLLDAAGQDNWQPWPVIDSPKSGTTGIVSGTSIDASVTAFNPAWAPGTGIRINGVLYTIYRVVSTSRLEIVENAGSQNAVSWQIDEPTLLGQPLACLWGSEQLGAMFGCGDPLNPGRLYYSNGNDPDGTRERNYVDVASPSEPLMNGCVYNLRSYVFSSERMFQVLQGPDGSWYPQEIPNGRGLFARWGIIRTSAPIMAILGKDGIYATQGGIGLSVTDADLYPLFPNEGNIGQATNGILAPSITAADQTSLRLEYYDEYLYFDYKDTAGNYRTLAMNLDLGNFSQAGQGGAGGWFYDEYSPGIVCHYGEEGPNVHSLLLGGNNAGTGMLYQYTGDSDDGVPIPCQIRTPSRDQGDARGNKLYGDVMLDADTEGLAVVTTPFFNNGDTSSPAVVVTTLGRVQTPIALGAAWITARNIALDVSFSVSGTARPRFYIWEPRWTFESAPISSASWEISATTFGMANWKHMGLVRVTHVSSAPLTLTVALDGVVHSVAIPASGGIYTQSVFRVPVWKAKLWKIRLDSPVPFRLDTRDTYFELREWGTATAYNEMRIFGDFATVEG